jgi:integrase
MKKKITKSFLEGDLLKKERGEVFDTLLPSFGIRRTRKGKAGYFIVYRSRGTGKKVRLAIGKYPALSPDAARELAGKLLTVHHRKGDPVAALEDMHGGPSDADLSVRALVDRYIEAIKDPKNKKHRRSWDQAEKIYNLHVIPKFGGRQLASIKAEVWLNHFKEIGRAAPTSANRVHSAMTTLYNWCRSPHQTDIAITENPLLGVEKLFSEEREARYLTAKEMGCVMAAAKEIGGPIGSIIEVQARTLLRRNEVTHLLWSCVDLKEGVIRLRGEDMKNGKPATIPLTRQASEIIERQPKRSEYVFANPNTGKHFTNIYRAKAKVDKLSGVGLSKKDRWRFHDFRATGATTVAEKGWADIMLADRLLNHQPGKKLDASGQRYQASEQLGPRRKVLQKYNDWIDQQIAVESGENVLPMVAS